jgi:hypothetical protein
MSGALMVSITVAFLAGLAGLFVVLGSTEETGGWCRGFRPREVLCASGIVFLAALVRGVVAVTLPASSRSGARSPGHPDGGGHLRHDRCGHRTARPAGSVVSA